MPPLFYLKTLVIQNFATFKNQSINCEKGINAIIGETGSGKSLVLEAIELILGGRADKRVVRKNTDTTCVEARFVCNDPRIQRFFQDEGYLIEENEIIIKRLISKTGVTKNYINHQSCTVTLLSNFSKSFIDIVGQFDNQKLLSDSYQLTLLDQYAKNDELLFCYQTLLNEFKIINQKITELINTQTHRNQRLDYLNYQLEEINRLNPSSQDEEEIIRKKNIFLNLEKSQRLSGQIDEIFEGGDSNYGLEGLTQSLNSIILKNPDQLSNFSDQIINITDELAELRHEMSLKLEQEINISEYEDLLERLDLYQRVKKKFSDSVEGILQAQIDFLKEKNQLEELDINLKDVVAKKDSILLELEKLSEKLHKSRIKMAPQLASELTQKIRTLNMNGATIELRVEELSELNDSGKTKVHFFAETNKGEGYFKIKDIASGGELSRILLGLRQVLSRYDSIGIFLFDEIDTGIGGETAITIGRALLEVASQGQVIAITHLPQIAQFASNLIIVEKQTQEVDSEVRTESIVKMIRGKLIQQEVKSMINLH